MFFSDFLLFLTQQNQQLHDMFMFNIKGREGRRGLKIVFKSLGDV